MKNIWKYLLGILIISSGALFFFYRIDYIDEVDSDAIIIGYISEISENTFLVTEKMQSEDDEQFLNGDAIYFSIDESTKFLKENQAINFSDLKKGNKVEVWNKGTILESYPSQTTASKVILVQEGENQQSFIDCFIGGCGAEICSKEKDIASTCELLPGMECLDMAGVECVQINGDCGWVLSAEAANCFMNVKEKYPDAPNSRIGYLFDLAEDVIIN